MSLCRIPLPTKMYALTLLVLLQGFGLAWPKIIEPLGMTVHVVPQESTSGKTVRAHFTAIISGECSDVSSPCDGVDNCVVEENTVPFTGTLAGSSWCSHHWQQTLDSNYEGTISFGPGASRDLFVKLKADPVVRANSGKLNHPAFVALPPPLRARENCPHHFPLAVRDLDGDRVRCRFALEDQDECNKCDLLSFVELDSEKCSLTFTGDAKAGEYHVYLMAEDRVPSPSSMQAPSAAMSAVPVVLSLTVEAAVHSCSVEPVASEETLKENSVMEIFPYSIKNFSVEYDSAAESVTDIAVIGPPGLYRVRFASIGSLSSLDIAWVRTENKLPLLVPICFVANTASLQSEPRCVWLYQRETLSLPTGTVLTCDNSQMTLALPTSALTQIRLSDLRLNDPDCTLSFNDTFLFATIPLLGCGTLPVHSGDELIYTNKIYTDIKSTQVIRRSNRLVLPLACRIPGVKATGPNYKNMDTPETKVFGPKPKVALTFHFPGQGPLSKFTKNPNFRTNTRRVRREVGDESKNATSNTTTAAPSVTEAATTAAIGSQIQQLDMYVSSNSSAPRVEMIVNSCWESETEDFKNPHLVMESGCTATASVTEIVTNVTGTKVFRMNLPGLNTAGTVMYMRCTVNLCVALLPSGSCPDLCTTKISRATLVNSVFSSSYTVTSDPISLVVTKAPPTTITTTPTTTTPTTTTTTAPTTTTTAPTTTTTAPTTANAPEKAPSMALGVLLALIILQPFL
ncbi:unnamed protein product [Knipowitschia caucasica]|uniref:ZP domain-containing protein n=1 Tax=Knipowitschia caucasica TaxID=637954 RepID=A0AAV2LVD2_KNICA